MKNPSGKLSKGHWKLIFEEVASLWYSLQTQETNGRLFYDRSLKEMSVTATIGESCTNPSRDCDGNNVVCDTSGGTCVCDTNYVLSGSTCISVNGEFSFFFPFAFGLYPLLLKTAVLILSLSHPYFFQRTTSFENKIVLKQEHQKQRHQQEHISTRRQHVSNWTTVFHIRKKNLFF